MVEAKLVQDSGIQVVNVDLVLDRIKTKVSGLSVGDSTPGEPHGKGIGVMIPAIRSSLGLRERWLNRSLRPLARVQVDQV